MPPTQELEELIPLAVSYVAMFVIAVWGFLSDFCHRILQGKIQRPYKLTFLLELPGAVFLAVVTYYVCNSLALDAWLTAALMGTASHLGARVIYPLEDSILRRLLGKVEAGL